MSPDPAPRPARVLRPLAAAALAVAALPSAAGAQEDLDVPYVPTPPEVVSRMLELAEPTPRDTLYDLGSGDGRIVITAAERYGTPGVGVELDPARVATSRKNAEDARVADLVRFVEGDLFEADLRPASIVTLYLFPEVNRKLRPRLFEQLDPGDRVVSHDFSMGAWRADTVVRVERRDGTGSRVYFWVVPADVGGTWELALPGERTATARLDQRYQFARVALPGRPDARASEARVRADTVRFTLRGVLGGGPVRLTGVHRDGRIEGTTGDGRPWSARRTADTDSSILAWEESP